MLDLVIVGVLVPKLSSRTIRQAVAVVGCIIMPHNVFLHSALVQSRKVDIDKKGRVQEALNYYSIESALALAVSFMINVFVTTVFAKGFYGTDKADGIGLVNAGQFLQEKYGGGLFPILYIWAIGLLAAGQSSTITGTYAGQFIMGGFLNLRLKKWMRSLITRSFAIVPTIIVALIFNTSEGALDDLNEWLNVLQSIQVPFAVIPLLCLVSKEQVMGTFKIGSTLKVILVFLSCVTLVLNVSCICFILANFFLLRIWVHAGRLDQIINDTHNITRYCCRGIPKWVLYTCASYVIAVYMFVCFTINYLFVLPPTISLVGYFLRSIGVYLVNLISLCWLLIHTLCIINKVQAKR